MRCCAVLPFTMSVHQASTIMAPFPQALFVGTRPLAARCLRHLIDVVGRSNISAVLTLPKNADRWWRAESAEEVSDVAEAYSIPLISESELVNTDFDLLLCVYWGTIFDDAVLTRPGRRCYNLHTAPLPDYRGSLSYSHAIINGDTHYGATMHRMSYQVDRGDVIGDVRFPILTTDTARSLYDQTVRYSYLLFCQLLEAILLDVCMPVSQVVVTARTGREPRYYSSRSLDAMRVRPDVLPDRPRLETLHRALTFPPRFYPPTWLDEALDRRSY